MAFSEDIPSIDVCCEICGVRLEDEIVIQEFADGSLARLCPECAAGVAFDPVGGSDAFDEAHAPYETEAPSAAPSPEPDATTAAEPAFDPTPSVFPDITENDPMEMTKELLMPVTDLIALQSEMQEALERLAASLERFAVGFISDTMSHPNRVDSRIEMLEAELERTRMRLRETESLLITTTSPLTPEVTPTESTTAARDQERPSAEWPTESEEAAAPTDVARGATPQPVPQPQAAAPTGSPDLQTQGPEEPFCLEEIRGTQRLFNESPFVERVRSVQRSLGKPKANLSRVTGTEPRVLLTVIWDIIWYQYLVDLRPDIPSSERVTCFREGMDMDELAAHFQEKNAIIDEDGRVDASEMEVRLLSDPTVLITEMPVDVEQALEDATEEIWDQHISPEFNWDD